MTPSNISISIYNIAVVSSKAKLLWPPYTSTKAINFFLFLLLFVYSISHIYNVNAISKCKINKTEN